MSKIIQAIVVFALALLTYLVLPESCPEDAQRCAFILVLAAGMWALEIFPIYVTSLLVVLLLSFMIKSTPYTEFLVPFASPVIMLFFGGFILARALGKYGADQFLACKVLHAFGDTSYQMILGLIFTTAFLSMWISNTAATLIMIGIAYPIYQDKTLNVSFRKGLLLCIPFSANIGGLATPIGTPPNALAIGFLSDYGISISFLVWMTLCLPLVFLCLLVMFGVITLFYFRGIGELTPPKLISRPLSTYGYKTLAVAAATIALWLTSSWHGIPEPLTALLAVGMLMAMNLISREDIKNIDWDVLILMWGGLALGIGIEKSGLGLWMVEHLFPNWSGIYLVALFATVGMILSLFISNTASAALILPIALEAAGESKPLFGVTIALMCSIAMVFPVSTPPNAIVFGTGEITNMEMIRTGAVVTLFCYLIILAGFWWIIPGFL